MADGAFGPEALTNAQTEMVESTEGNGAWLRAWPSGHVHYSPNWISRNDGRFDTACGRTRIYWPEVEWPKAPLCQQCLAIGPKP